MSRTECCIVGIHLRAFLEDVSEREKTSVELYTAGVDVNSLRYWTSSRRETERWGKQERKTEI